MKRSHKITIMVLLIVILFAGSMIAIVFMKNEAKTGQTVAYVYRDNELLEEIDLNEVREPYQITVDYAGDAFNVLEVREGSVGIVDASCPDLLCKNMGFISDSVMPITCLPNHLVIKIEKKNGTEEGDSSTVDGMAY